MAVTRENFKQILLGILNPNATNASEAESVAEKINERVYILPLQAGGFSAAVNTNTTNGFACLMKTDRALKLKGAHVIMSSNVTSDNTDYKSIIIQKNDANGSAGVNIALGNTTNSGATASLGGNLVANGAYDLTLTAANVTVNANQGILVSVLSPGAGVTLGLASKLVLRFEET